MNAVDDVVVASTCSDDKTDIGVKNHNGLGLSEDFMDIDRLEGATCLKCDRGDGNLLLCCQFGCPVALHESCTNGGPKFDNYGNFYCPYCWYKREVVRTQELRKKAIKAKKDLARFIDFKRDGSDKEKENGRTDRGKGLNDEMDNGQLENQRMELEEEQTDDRDKAKLDDSSDQFEKIPKNQRVHLTPLSHRGENINRSHEKTPEAQSLANSTSKEISSEEKISKTYELEILEDGETIQVKDSGQVDDNGHEKIVEDDRGHEKIVENGCGHQKIIENDCGYENITEGQQQEEPYNTSCGERENVVDGSHNISKENISDQGRREEKENLDPKTLGAEMSDSDTEIISKHQRQLRQRSKKEQSQYVGSPKKLSSARGATPVKIARTRKEKATASKKSTQISAGKFKGFSFANEKRKRLLWTAEEEDMLKEGVHKFSSKVNRNLPWRKVLEFGCHVFDPTRTPADLKDKWRNIMAKESSGANRR